METAKMLKLLSVQRHDFLNHLQVISGYVQLGKPDRARDYIADLAHEIKRLSKVVHLQAPEAAAALLMGHNLAAEHQVDISYDIQADLNGCAVPGEILEPVLEKIIKSFIICLAPPENTDRNVYVHIEPAKEGFLCRLITAGTEAGCAEANVEQYRWVEQELAPYGGSVTCQAGESCSEITLFLPKLNA